MAKSEKKISIASLDKVLKEQAVDIATEQWFGNEVKIKHTLSFSEALAFVDDVVSSCFHTTGGYMPELQEFVVKSNILTRYANFNLPDNLEHRYSLLYNTDAVDVVIRHINQKQLDDILESISEKISYLCESNIAAIERQMNEVVSAFTELQKKDRGYVCQHYARRYLEADIRYGRWSIQRRASCQGIYESDEG